MTEVIDTFVHQNGTIFEAQIRVIPGQGEHLYLLVLLGDNLLSIAEPLKVFHREPGESAALIGLHRKLTDLILSPEYVRDLGWNMSRDNIVAYLKAWRNYVRGRLKMRGEGENW